MSLWSLLNTTSDGPCVHMFVWFVTLPRLILWLLVFLLWDLITNDRKQIRYIFLWEKPLFSVRRDYSQIPSLAWEEQLEFVDILFGKNESRAALTSSNSPKNRLIERDKCSYLLAKCCTATTLDFPYHVLLLPAAELASAEWAAPMMHAYCFNVVPVRKERETFITFICIISHRRFCNWRKT